MRLAMSYLDAGVPHDEVATFFGIKRRMLYIWKRRFGRSRGQGAPKLSTGRQYRLFKDREEQGMTYRELGAAYGVSPTTALRAVRRVGDRILAGMPGNGVR